MSARREGTRRSARRRWFAPEVVQTSPMDCGPAALKCLLEGHGIHAAYGRLREACQTEVDGTSIDTLEEVARELGLSATQSLVPIDHIAHRRSNVLPAIVVVRLPSGANHFVVAWRRVGRWLQIMDPGSGRRWVRREDFARIVYEHALDMPASAWRRWASSEIYRGVLAQDLQALGHREPHSLLDRALADPGWRSLASLDAALRMTRSLVHSGALAAGATAARLVESLFEDGCSGEPGEARAIPPAYWIARPHAAVAGREQQLNVRGAVVVRVRGVARDLEAAHAAQLEASRSAQLERDSAAQLDADRTAQIDADRTAHLEAHRAAQLEPDSAAPLDADRTASRKADRVARLDRDSERTAPAERGPVPKPAAARPLSPELAAAISEPPSRPLREIWMHLRAEGWLHPAVLASAAGLSAALLLAQALLFRAMFDLGGRLALREQRVSAFIAVLVFLGSALLIELPLSAAMLRAGRQLETRLRIAFQRAIPRLPDRYFASRPSSDMAERAHSLAVLRSVPATAMRVARALFQLVFTALGLLWLDPGSTWVVVAASLTAGLAPFLFQRMLTERELAVRSHHGALMRFYLESLLGIVAVRAHRAEKSLRAEHEGLLVEWVRTGRRLARATIALRAVTSSMVFGLSALLVMDHFARHGWAAGELLFAYWALGLPALGEQLAQAVLQIAPMRNAALRALEPLRTPASHAVLEETGALARQRDDTVAVHALSGTESRTHLEGDRRSHADIDHVAASTHLKAAGAQTEAHAIGSGATELWSSRAASTPRPLNGVAIELCDVALTISGRSILSAVDLELAPGEHVALVGASGAGKSSLIGLLLGFHRPASGTLLVDGHAFDAERVHELRAACAWVDPAVQLWNRTLFENLVYGIESTSTNDLASALESADLSGMFESLPDGLQTSLGEGGAFLSGGEGQRARFGRALLRPGVRLALLDEPFRGLDRARRIVLLDRAREHWRDATLVCATHDLEETRAFDRVIVLEAGRIVEDGDPHELALDKDSRYRAMLDAERRVQDEIWSNPIWTHWHIANGELTVKRADKAP